MPGSGWGDTANVLPGFDSVDLANRGKVEETLRRLRWERSVTPVPETKGLFSRLAEASRLRMALTTIVVVGAGSLALNEAWNYGDNSARQYMKDHPSAVQEP